MTIQDNHFTKQHTLHLFDGELEHLQSLTLAMIDLLMYQLEQAMQALEDGDMKMASKVISRDNEVNHYEIKIDSKVLEVLARHCPVANDLRTVISTSLIAVELEKIGDEIANFAKLIMVLYQPRTSFPTPKLLADIVKIGHLVKTMLSQQKADFVTGQSNEAYVLLQYDFDCENKLQEGIKHQLDFVVRDVSLIGRALDIMLIMKALERCSEHCQNIAEYMIFMIDGIDVRHDNHVVKS